MQLSVMFFSTGGKPGADIVYDHICDIARAADEQGLTRIWLPERHFVDFGAVHPNPALLAAALAQITSRIRLAAGSVVAPLHDPLRIVEDWSVVDNISRGRIDMALASGWRSEDFVLAEDLYAERHAILADRAEVVRHLWRGETLSRRAGDGQTVEVRTQPRPQQTELPLWITAARNPESFKLAGSLGTNLLTYLVDLGMDGLSRCISAYRKARSEAGYDANQGTVTVMLHTHLDPSGYRAKERSKAPYIESVIHNRELLATHGAQQLSEAQARQIASAQFERLYERLSLVGSVEAGQRLVQQLEYIGVDEIACLVDFIEDFEVVKQGLPGLVALHQRITRHASPTPADGTAGAKPLWQASGSEFYAYIESIGGHYGPDFCCIEHIEYFQDHARIELSMPGGAVHPDPILLDAIVSCAHVFELQPALRGNMRPMALPAGIGRLWLGTARSDRYVVLAREKTRDNEYAEFDLTVTLASGDRVAELAQLRFKRMPVMAGDARMVEATQSLHRLAWEPAATCANPEGFQWSVEGEDPQDINRWTSELGDASASSPRLALVLPAQQRWRLGDLEAPRSAAANVLETVERLRAAKHYDGIMIMTCGSQAVPGDDLLPDPSAAAAWAAAGSVLNKPGQAWVRVLDVSPVASLSERAQALRMFAAQNNLPMAAARGGVLLGPKLSPSGMTNAPRQFNDFSRVLVTGGHGGLGRLLVDWLAETNIPEVVAISRTGQAPRTIRHTTATKLVDLQADVTKLSSEELGGTPLQGFDAIFHLAGIDPAGLDGRPAIEAAFAPKFDGMFALAELARHSAISGPLILFASSAGLLGAQGQAAYAAANAAAMAAASHLRHDQKLDVRVVALDPLRDIGMVKRVGVSASLAARGIRMLDPSVALRALGVTLAEELEQALIIAPGNHQSASSSGAASRPENAQHHPFLAEIDGLQPKELEREVLRRIRNEAAEILEVSFDEVDPTANLYDIGFDSVMALELRDTLHRKYRVEVGLAPLMEAQCLDDVARAILPALQMATGATPNARIDHETEILV